MVSRTYLKILFTFCVLTVWCSVVYSYPDNYPQKIISLGSSITEELYLLGVGDRIIGNTIYCNRPKDAENKEKVGTVIKVNLEKIIELKPDLVLATSLTDRQQLQKMKDLKINLVEITAEKDFQEICANFLKLGELVGKQKEAQDLIREVRIKVDFIKDRAKNLTKQKTLVQIGAAPLFVASKKYFINDFIELAGGINIACDTKTGLYSREEVLKQNPDVIIIATMGIVGQEEKKTWKKYGSINAVKNNRIYIVDSYKLCSATPVTFMETLEEIVKILHPEINE